MLLESPAVNEELVILGHREAAPQAFHTLEDKAKAWQGLLRENPGRGQVMTGTVMKGHGDRGLIQTLDAEC